MSGFLLWSIVLCFALLLGFKIGPPYFEFMKINKQLQAVVQDSEAQSGQRRDVENAFTKRATIEDINAVSAKDLVITKEGDGIVLSVDYQVCVPVVANLKACMDFSASSRRR
jgi:NAD kinase